MEQKSFAFYIFKETIDRSRGGRKLEICVLSIVDNVPKNLGVLKVHTMSWKGAPSEVMNWLGKNGFISREFSNGYYGHDFPEIHGITIHNI